MMHKTRLGKDNIINQQLKWMVTVKHFRNYLDTTNNDTIDYNHKISTFICYVHKFVCNYSHLQANNYYLIIFIYYYLL